MAEVAYSRTSRGQGKTRDLPLDERGRFVLQDYQIKRPFASFLPGIAGPLGIPMWVFYVNRGQAVASFGIENKDNPVMEFEPANRAYQSTPYTGFRTFIRLNDGMDARVYEPFAPWSAGDETRMLIGMNELEIEATSATHNLRTTVHYFLLAGEPFCGLVRQVTVTNVGNEPLALEMLDGMARVVPYGVDNRTLKEMGRTAEAWMAVFNLENSLPFYRLQASAGDTAHVSRIEAGHFYMAFDELGRGLDPFVDPVVVFGQNTALSAPDGFVGRPLRALSRQRQITTGRTPCGFFGTCALLGAGESKRLYAIIGHVSSLDRIRRERTRLSRTEYVRQKQEDARRLVGQLTDVVDTDTSSPLFDAYTRQAFLDNVLRGGWPILLGEEEPPVIYHIYSRKHGDLERDYNYFRVAAEPYSQGNASYRDVNQNRRCDVLLRPEVADYNVKTFLGLIQGDGYNPLAVEGSRFTLQHDQRADVLRLVERPDRLAPMLAREFTPGQLLRAAEDHEIGLRVAPDTFVPMAVAHAEQQLAAAFGEGYWIDHWIYNLDLLDTYLAVYPDRKEDLLYDRQALAFWDSPALVQPRSRKYVLGADGQVHQYGAVIEDEEKAALIAARSESPNQMRGAHGNGEVVRTSVLGKLVLLALLKFATLDPLGMGVEMEAGKPGWYDALNGLPAMFGSSMCETFELERLLRFTLAAISGLRARTMELPVEAAELMDQVADLLQAWSESDDSDRDFKYWDAVSSAREAYRTHIRLGFAGETRELAGGVLRRNLGAFLSKVRAGIRRAVEMNDGVPPTYFAYSVTDYDLIVNAEGKPERDEQGRSYVKAKGFDVAVLPLFLEGPVHALKVQPDAASARALHAAVRDSDLYDRKLGLYKVNASLASQPHAIGRARAFTPGWLENESVFLHMEYKYLLEVLRAGLYEEFFEDFRRALVCFQDAEAYGRSPLENSSFLVSSAHPDETLHGVGFVARLTGATAEFLSMWTTMMAGPTPFFMDGDELCLALKPILPEWLFDENGEIAFAFLGRTKVTYHNPDRIDSWKLWSQSTMSAVLCVPEEGSIEFADGIVREPYAEMVRQGRVASLDVFLG
jgi:hypothetical protein